MGDTKEVRDLKRKLNQKEKQIDRHKEHVLKTKKEVEKHKEKAQELREERRTLRKTIRKHADVYVIESKKAISTALLAAFAFLMALSWREYIIVVIDSIESYSPVQGKLISALIVTFICVIGIILVTRLLTVKEK